MIDSFRANTPALNTKFSFEKFEMRHVPGNILLKHANDIFLAYAILRLDVQQTCSINDVINEDIPS